MKKITRGDIQYWIGGLVGLGEVILAICLTNLLIFANFGFSGLSDMGLHTTLVFCASLVGISAMEYLITSCFLKLGAYLYQKRGKLNASEQPGI